MRTHDGTVTGDRCEQPQNTTRDVWMLWMQADLATVLTVRHRGAFGARAFDLGPYVLWVPCSELLSLLQRAAFRRQRTTTTCARPSRRVRLSSSSSALSCYTFRERLIRGLIPFGVYCSADLGMEPRPIEPTYLNSNARFETSAFADALERYSPLVSA